MLCEIWNEVLLRDDIKSSDNIFDVGGTSLALLSVANLLEHRIGLKVTAVDFFEFPYISDFSSAMSTRKFQHVVRVTDASIGIYLMHQRFFAIAVPIFCNNLVLLLVLVSETFFFSKVSNDAVVESIVRSP